MTGDLLGLVAAVRGTRALVVGDAIVDRYLVGTPAGMCREAPVPVLDLTGAHDQCGGAANVAANLRSLGAEPRLLAVAGADPAGRRLRAALAAAGLGSGLLVTDESRPTAVKHRVLAPRQMLLRMDEGGREPVGRRTAATLAARLAEQLSWCDVVIACDYGYGAFTEEVTEVLAASRRRPLLVVDSRTPAAFRAIRPDAVKPNYAEAVALLGQPPLGPEGDRAGQIQDHAGLLLERSGADLAAVTLDRDGAVVLQAGRPSLRTYADGEAKTTVGAGDTFTSALALALAAGADPGAAAEFASAAADTVVRKPGTANCDPAELRRRLAGAGKIQPGGELPAWLTDVPGRGSRVVFTNGCFDLLHGGHVSLLSRAKAFGELLVVGVNSDESVRRLKGPARPVLPLAERMRVLAALGCVDVVVPFAADSPAELIERLRPDVYVKGDDYTRQTLPEAPLVERLGGVVELLSTVGGLSTSKIIREIRALSAVDEQRAGPDRKGA
ncbi:D-glycero-beta-D-manno-heptose 1-phosphate adenylyltransferase [Amycolatopsis rubida]|uniref:D-glycero-beta-D-manno-heptose 1-phosphate adenylyltransferase n=2 Tax=Amycolatopsis rubida TaxID=112413 RepID=A0A1I6AJ16_9PSEU|nr:D-glycero-beta-D-manno-heptose 1-phosphate adenylyltransferase [Amycolatopsis rubida]SFQ68688.1 D-beta-D-heptose 7-phosphate kinase / D-beta-D-heptose 1-phosphate adenosyltransferase [Amycolatopsis rubida]